MKHRLCTRLFPLLLALTLLLAPAAQALTLEQAKLLLLSYYIDEVPEEALAQTSIQDMLTVLGDPYTYYFTPEEYQQFTGSMSDQNLVGIGISSLTTEEGLLLQRVYENTPAAEGGLLAGDLITAVDGRSVTGESSDLVTTWIQGEAGTTVSITYRRDGADHTVTLTRRALVLPSTVTELWEGHIGYIDCSTFGGETLAHFTEGMEAYGEQADRWIVDLRGNGGGEVSAAIRSANCFTGPETLAYLRDGSGQYQGWAGDQEALTTAPVIVLCNSATASAAELFAAGIRDTGTGLVIGSRTYGKGVAQNVFDQTAFPLLFEEGDAMKITAYRFYSHAGSTDDTIGILPHLLVAPGLAPQVAVLLSASAPEGAPQGMLRFDLGELSWYVDLEQALSDDYRDAFTALLEAVPVGARVFAGGGTEWSVTSPSTLAELHWLADYQRRGFSDSVQSRFAGQIDTLAAYGVLYGSGDGSFRPFDTLTRAQLCALLAQALNCSFPRGESRFADVSLESWYGPAVNALAELGLVDGTGNGLFRPDDPVTHEQFITIMGRLAVRLNLDLDLTARHTPAAVQSAEVFSTWSPWARAWAWLLSMSQQDGQDPDWTLLWDPLRSIDPAGTTTREEAAALTYSLLSYTGILPV